MAILANDNFTRADSTSIGSNWSEVSGDFQIVSNKLRLVTHNAADDVAAWVTNLGASPAADYDVEVTGVFSGGGGGGIGSAGRIADINNYYLVQTSPLDDAFALYKKVAGSYTQLGSTYSTTLSDDVTYTTKLTMAGSSLSAYLDGVQRVTATDSALTATGKPGIRGFSNNNGQNYSAFTVYGTGIINFDAASNSGYQASASTYNWSHTCTGLNRYLVVGVSMLSVIGSSVTSITYNSISMTLLGAIASVSGAVRTELWGLVAPTEGSNTIAVTLSTGLISAAGAVSFIGVNQTTPTEAFNSATATNVGAADATVNVTTVATNDWVIDQVATDDTAITVGASQTSRNNVTGIGGSGADSTEPATTAAAYTMSWTNVGALATWSIAAIGIRDINAVSLTLGAGYHGTLGWF